MCKFAVIIVLRYAKYINSQLFTIIFYRFNVLKSPKFNITELVRFINVKESNLASKIVWLLINEELLS